MVGPAEDVVDGLELRVRHQGLEVGAGEAFGVPGELEERALRHLRLVLVRGGQGGEDLIDELALMAIR